MPSLYHPRYRQRAALGNTLIGLFAGLVIGVLIAAGVVWYIFKTPPPFSNKHQSPPSATVGTPAAPGQPISLPGKPGDPAPPPQAGDPSQGGDKSRFDFYKMLPGDAKPEGNSTTSTPPANTAPNATKPDQNATTEALYLQAGAFQSAADADNQKAKLAMTGVVANVQQIMVQDKVWYRVRVGPFRKMNELTETRAELMKQGIESNIIKKD